MFIKKSFLQENLSQQKLALHLLLPGQENGESGAGGFGEPGNSETGELFRRRAGELGAQGLGLGARALGGERVEESLEFKDRGGGESWGAQGQDWGEGGDLGARQESEEGPRPGSVQGDCFIFLMLW